MKLPTGRMEHFLQIICTFIVICVHIGNTSKISCLHYLSHTKARNNHPQNLEIYCDTDEMIIVKGITFVETPVGCSTNPNQIVELNICEELRKKLTDQLRSDCNIKSYCIHLAHTIDSQCIINSDRNLNKLYMQVQYKCLKQDIATINGCTNNPEKVIGNDVYITTLDYPMLGSPNNCICNISTKADIQILDVTKPSKKMHTSPNDRTCPLNVEMPQSETICTGLGNFKFEEQTYSVPDTNWRLKITKDLGITQMRYFIYIRSTADSGTIMSVQCEAAMLAKYIENTSTDHPTSTVSTTVTMTSQNDDNISTGAIIGGSVLGGILLIVALLAVVFCIKSKRWPFNTKSKKGTTEQELGYVCHANMRIAQNLGVPESNTITQNVISPYAYTRGTRPDLLDNSPYSAVPNVYSEASDVQYNTIKDPKTTQANITGPDSENIYTDGASLAGSMEDITIYSNASPTNEQNPKVPHVYINGYAKPAQRVPFAIDTAYTLVGQTRPKLQTAIPSETQMIENDLYNT